MLEHGLLQSHRADFAGAAFGGLAGNVFSALSLLGAVLVGNLIQPVI